jgi:hypothetical protein
MPLDRGHAGADGEESTADAGSHRVHSVFDVAVSQRGKAARGER